MMEVTTDLHSSQSMVRGNVKKADSLEVHSNSYCESVQGEKTDRYAESEVMVESISSTTEHHLHRNPEKQQEAEVRRSIEKGPKPLSKKLKEGKVHSRTSSVESKHKSHESRRSSLPSGKDKSATGEPGKSESASIRKMESKDNMRTKRHSEGEVKRNEPEISSSSLVLAQRRYTLPKISYKSGNSHSFRTHENAPKHNYRDHRKQEYFKERDRATRQEKFKRRDHAPHYSSSENSISYEEMVEREVRKIRYDMKRMSKKISEPREGSTSRFVCSESECEEDERVRRSHEEWDSLTPFLPSAPCCTPPPRPPVTKYWSDADETEDESDTEKHSLHVNSVNIVLNYLKVHSEKYYKKGKEGNSQKKSVLPRKRNEGKLPFMSQSDLQWDFSKEKYVRKPQKSNRGGNLYSRHLSNRQHACLFVQDEKSPVPEHYDQYSCSPSPSGLPRKVQLVDTLRDILSKSSSVQAELYERGRSFSPPTDQRECHYRSRSPLDSRETEALQQRSSYSPLRHEDGSSRHLHSTHEVSEIYSPWHKRRSLTRESSSPFGHRSDLFRNRRSHSSSRYMPPPLRDRESCSPSRYRHGSPRDREPCSPPRNRHDSPRDRESRSHSRFRHDDSFGVREPQSYSSHRHDASWDREPHSPLRYRHDSLGAREAVSPSSKRHDSPWDRVSHSPSKYRDDSLRDRGSYSPSRYRGDSRKDRSSHSPSMYRHDSLRNRSSYSPSRHRGDSQRERKLQGEGSLRTIDTPLRSTEPSPSLSKRSPFLPSPGHNPLGAQLQEQDLSHEFFTSYSDSGCKRERSRSSKRIVSPWSEKSRKHPGNTLPLKHSERSQSFKTAESPSRWGESQSFSLNTGRQERSIRNNDYFFNPAVENTNEACRQQDSGPNIAQDQIQERDYERRHFTPNTEAEKITLYEARIHQPKDNLRDSRTGSLQHQENLPGPSGIANVTSSLKKYEDDLPDWFNEDYDINYDLEDLSGPLSEVSSLIEDHKAATADKTNSGAAIVPVEQEIATAESAKQEKEKACLTLDPAEMSTLLSLIQIAKEHTGKDLATSLPSILEKICPNKNASDLLGGPSGGEKKQSHMSEVSVGMHDKTDEAGKSRGSILNDNDKNYIKSNKSQVDQGVASSPSKENNQLHMGNALEINTVKRHSEIKESWKSQLSNSKLQEGEANHKPSGGKETSKTKDSSKSQQSKGKLMVKKAEEASDALLQEDINKEQSLKNKKDVKGVPYKVNPNWKSQDKRDKDNACSEIEKTFANMQQVRIYVEDAKQSRTRNPYKGATSMAFTSPAPTKPVDERLLARDTSDSRGDSESAETKKAEDAQSAPDKSPQTVHPLHQEETIVLDHSVNICLACKHKLVPDEYTSIGLSSGTVTMRCRVCHTFTRMKKALRQSYITRESDSQKSTLQKGTTKKRKGKHSPKNTPTSRMSQDKDSKYKKSKEDETNTSTNKDKGSSTSNNMNTMDPSLLVFPWSSDRKRKKIHENLKLYDSSSDSDEEWVKQQHKKQKKKRKRVIIHSSTSEDFDNDAVNSP